MSCNCAPEALHDALIESMRLAGSLEWPLICGLTVFAILLRLCIGLHGYSGENMWEYGQGSLCICCNGEEYLLVSPPLAPAVNQNADSSICSISMPGPPMSTSSLDI